MHECWRWFGPNDPVSLQDVAQAGASGIVTALHHVAAGEIWTSDEIAKRRDFIARAGETMKFPLAWLVVESLPVSEDIKQQSNDWRSHVDAYKESITNLAAAGVEVICYNFMPVIDWTRTDLAHVLPQNATCMRFDMVDFVAFDVFLLNRPGAGESFPAELVEEARARVHAMSDESKARLVDNVICGLPGGADGMNLDQLREHLAAYNDIDHDLLCQHQAAFLEMVAAHAEKLGVRLCCHPDDPPYPLLGLPRIMSTEADYARLVEAVDLSANGITLCSGSLGARAENDLPGMMRRLGDRVHFLHLRNVRREHHENFGSFHESEHLGGEVGMAALVAEVLEEEKRRKAAGRADHSIPFRPDHGQDILDDLTRQSQPGYPAVGRLKGLAELRGLISGLSYRAA